MITYCTDKILRLARQEDLKSKRLEFLGYTLTPEPKIIHVKNLLNYGMLNGCVQEIPFNNIRLIQELRVENIMLYPDGIVIFINVSDKIYLKTTIAEFKENTSIEDLLATTSISYHMPYIIFTNNSLLLEFLTIIGDAPKLLNLLL